MKELGTMDSYAMAIASYKQEIDRIKENMGNTSSRLEKEMRDAGVNEFTIPVSDLFEIKVKLTERTTTKVDKETLAVDLDVAVSAINTEFLLKAVEDGRLGLERFKQYKYQETNAGLSVRTVKAKLEKK